MMRLRYFLLIAVCSLAPRIAEAQRVPFFTPAGTGFDPEISVVNSGQLLDAQAVVSDDLKYVTINARASSSKLLALREFTFQGANAGPQLGFVGGPGMLGRQGMRFVGRLDDD